MTGRSQVVPPSSGTYWEGGDTGYYHTVAFWILGSLLKNAQSPWTGLPTSVEQTVKYVAKTVSRFCR